MTNGYCKGETESVIPRASPVTLCLPPARRFARLLKWIYFNIRRLVGKSAMMW